MAVSKPLIVPELSFTKGICQDYADYYIPGDPKSCADVIVSTLSKEVNSSSATKLLANYGDQGQRFHKIVNILDSVKEV